MLEPEPTWPRARCVMTGADIAQCCKEYQVYRNTGFTKATKIVGPQSRERHIREHRKGSKQSDSCAPRNTCEQKTCCSSKAHFPHKSDHERSHTNCSTTQLEIKRLAFAKSSLKENILRMCTVYTAAHATGVNLAPWQSPIKQNLKRASFTAHAQAKPHIYIYI